MHALWVRPARHAGAVPRVRCNDADPARMKRRLLNLLAAASLLLCVAVVALWVRSTWAPGLFLHRTLDEKGRRTGDVCAWTWRGSLVVQVGRLEEPQAGRDAVEEPAP